MNRRELFASLGAAVAVCAMPALASPAETKDVDHGAIVKGFIARKVAVGYQDLFLFKNRSGQWVFQVYDAKSGNPTTNESLFLLHGKPTKDGGQVMPPAGCVGTAYGIPVVAVEYDSRDTPEELNAKLNQAFKALMEHPVA
jgi:hypothetical protein